jgi:hypothetical protein
MRFVDAADALIARMLFVAPHTQTAAETDMRPAERAFTASLFISGARCIIQYIVLPFMLPIIGFVGGTPLWLLIPIDIIALASLVFSLRRFWQAGDPHRWTYLPLALSMALAIGAFLYYDIRAVAGP